MRRYQIAIKPIATATGEPGEWSLRAYGAKYSKAEAQDAKARLPGLGYEVRLLPVG